MKAENKVCEECGKPARFLTEMKNRHYYECIECDILYYFEPDFYKMRKVANETKKDNTSEEDND